MITSLLIANRGEIACRIVRTARRLGLRTVAVYSEADAHAQHVKTADAAVLLGPAPVNQSYLLADKVIAAAKDSGADAIHPGYGFLSENADFAEAIEKAGLIFVGPPASAIRAMGEKAAAKQRMQDAGVPVVPGYHGKDQDDALLAKEADAIGYPVLIKAVAGGGGKGMRQVMAPAQLAAALKGARREAASAFGDDKVLVEKYLERPRHIEVQVFADQHGNVVHLFERDCSIQRRHQKVIEEAPAPDMPVAMREAMGEAACRAAAAIGYVGAGTVEFIADASDGLSEERFYFMEMNTRLQVEHPVTEMITGQDLVAWQLQIAAGAPLPLRQDEIHIDGHALEVRLYAETPERKFFPSSGPLRHFRLPDEQPHFRVDSGVVAGDTISVYYDPMIAKLITKGCTRDEAIQHMSRALSHTAIVGVGNNVAFLHRTLSHPAFQDGAVHTGFIDEHGEVLLRPRSIQVSHIIATLVADSLLGLSEKSKSIKQDDPYSPWNIFDGWRLNGQGQLALAYAYGDEVHDATVHFEPAGDWFLTFAGETHPLFAEYDGTLRVQYSGQQWRATVIAAGLERHIFIDGETYTASFIDPARDEDLEDEGTGQITAPLPGKVVQVLVADGDTVEKGQSLLIVEAMKMEHTIQAPTEGVIAEIPFNEGEQVDEGAVLVRFQETPE